LWECRCIRRLQSTASSYFSLLNEQQLPIHDNLDTRQMRARLLTASSGCAAVVQLDFAITDVDNRPGRPDPIDGFLVS
jgi:hypothetical protein